MRHLPKPLPWWFQTQYPLASQGTPTLRLREHRRSATRFGHLWYTVLLISEERSCLLRLQTELETRDFGRLDINNKAFVVSWSKWWRNPDTCAICLPTTKAPIQWCRWESLATISFSLLKLCSNNTSQFPFPIEDQFASHQIRSRCHKSQQPNPPAKNYMLEAHKKQKGKRTPGKAAYIGTRNYYGANHATSIFVAKSYL